MRQMHRVFASASMLFIYKNLAIDYFGYEINKNRHKRPLNLTK